MSKKSRNKGAGFEREVANLCRETFGIDCTRNLNQWAEAGLCDIDLTGSGLPFFIECKRYAQGNFFQPSWWEQVCNAAKGKAYPCLVWRYDRQPLRVTLPVIAVNPEFGESFGYDFNCNQLSAVTMDWDTAAMIMREFFDD
jgi:Holliday junction resolvase